MKRNREDILAAAFAAAGPGAAFDPIQLQVLLFLIHRNVPNSIGGPRFDFQPGPLGPADDALYREISAMATAGDAAIDQSGPTTLFRLSDAGQAHGEAVLATLDSPVADYFGRAARWTRLVPRRPMLRSVFRQYPEMAANCAVNDWVEERRERQEAERRLHPFAEGFVRAFDLFGMMGRPRASRSAPESDAEAIGEAWREVGGFIEEAMVSVGKSERLW